MATTPAPDATVRLRAAPRYDPPYDDERSGELWAPGPAQPLLALASPSPAGPPWPPAGLMAGGRPGTLTRVKSMPPAPAASPPVTAAAVRFVNTCLEIFNGYRPVGHFRALASPLTAATVTTDMAHALRRLRRVTGHSGSVLVKVRQMRTCEPAPDVAEIAAVIGTGRAPQPTGAAIPRLPDRVWAFASRLERRDGRWLCTAARVL